MGAVEPEHEHPVEQRRGIHMRAVDQPLTQVGDERAARVLGVGGPDPGDPAAGQVAADGLGVWPRCRAIAEIV